MEFNGAISKVQLVSGILASYQKDQVLSTWFYFRVNMLHQS
jgi:hypothetical protein